ncbi:MAG: peptidoglycan DD-metalloendopeptidase family protein [Candidatus Terrybacteria bacterium]|nr:peptidoglycan DD-metalloendopeptidase family protein [Candidatus Terrybacteria bacterium]
MQNDNLKFKNNFVFWIVILIFTFYILYSINVSASTIDELKARIEERSRQMEEIQKEIDQYQEEIEKNAQQASTLKNEIKKLETIKKKLIADISLTQKQIESTEYTIEKIILEIEEKENDIKKRLGALGEIIRNINDAESVSLTEIILSQNKFSDFFSDIQHLKNFQREINLNLEELKELKELLEEEKSNKEEKKNSLEQLKFKLTDQKQLADLNKKNKDKLLQETKNKESVYKKLLAERLAKQQALEEEIKEFEEQIRIIIDPASLPPAGSGVLKWPLDSIKITQYFGNTSFATQNPQVYNGKGHNGVDFRATPGTTIKSSQTGTVRAIGNTDESCKGVSYGKWILIDHPNNLSTLYSHLSLIKVSTGQDVEVGQIIGYSGDTGYTTGPHLHFAVFATKGVEIGQIQSKICGTIMRLPVASYNGYLNPLSYL